MTTTHLPLDTWMVVEQHSRWTQLDLVSRHSTRAAAEAERDRKNGGSRERPYRACLIVEPIAQRMGGHPHPLSGTCKTCGPANYARN
jgi:hypothetical protein